MKNTNYLFGVFLFVLLFMALILFVLPAKSSYQVGMNTYTRKIVAMDDGGFVGVGDAKEVRANLSIEDNYWVFRLGPE